MEQLNKEKHNYESTPIPPELSTRIQLEILESRRKHRQAAQSQYRRWSQRALRGVVATAASAAVAFTLALNTVPAFAAETAQLPVIGPLAQLLTFRSYETQENDIAISVEIPSIETIQQDTGLNAKQINEDILARCEQYAQDAKERAETYRTAFLETGGTEEEWAAHKIKITVGYEIKQQDEQYLSFVIRGKESWSNLPATACYYTLDLTTGALVSLQDLLGDDYETQINTQIRQQIAQREAAGETFFSETEGGFAGITPDTQFYVNASHNPVIVFDKYEIAAGSAGEIEFEIGG